jgi:Amt family ammonium transporter
LNADLADTAVGTIAFVFIGYALCKGNPPDGNSFIDLNPDNILVIKTDNYVDVYYLLSFACVACTIMSGALAERAFHGPYGVYSGVVAGFIFPTVAYWTWSTDGWLLKLGYLDTAGTPCLHGQLLVRFV